MAKTTLRVPRGDTPVRVDAVSDSHAVLARHARSFSWAAIFLDSQQRDDAAVLYAFCRLADDLADETTDPNEALEGLATLRAELVGALPARPLVAATLEVFRRCDIDLDVAHDLLDGVGSDVSAVVALPDDETLLEYCYQVAGTVGLMMCGVMGVRDPEARGYAVDLGIAMQLTNLCRDVVEDAERKRVYLPDRRLRAAGTTPNLLLQGRALPAAVRAVVSDLLGLADERYLRGDQGLRFIPWRARLAVAAASRIYRAIGWKLRRRGYDVFEGRTVVSPVEKIRWLLAGLVRACRA